MGLRARNSGERVEKLCLNPNNDANLNFHDKLKLYAAFRAKMALSGINMWDECCNICCSLKQKK